MEWQNIIKKKKHLVMHGVHIRETEPVTDRTRSASRASKWELSVSKYELGSLVSDMVLLTRAVMMSRG